MRHLLPLILAALLAVLPHWALAQSGLTWSGTYTPGHAVMQISQGVVGDAGPAAGSTTQGYKYLTELGITNTGTPFCISSALISSAGYYQLCLGASTLGGGLISYNAYGTASQAPLNFNINGQMYQFPALLSGIGGPATTVINDGACWANTVGTLLKDCPAASVTSVGLALPGSVFSVSGSPVTSTGTLTGAFISQSANLGLFSPNGTSGVPTFRNAVGADFGTQSANFALIGPSSGAAAAPTFRALVANDFPITGVTAGTYGSQAQAPSVTVNANGLVTGASQAFPVAFYIDKGGTNQTGIPSATYTQVTWSTAKFNNGGGTFASNRWTAPISGYIQMSVSFLLNADVAVTGNTISAKIEKNPGGSPCTGSDVFAAIGNAIYNSPGLGLAQGSAVDFATAGDVYEVCMYVLTTDGLANGGIDGNAAHTYWSGVMVP